MNIRRKTLLFSVVIATVAGFTTVAVLERTRNDTLGLLAGSGVAIALIAGTFVWFARTVATFPTITSATYRDFGLIGVAFVAGVAATGESYAQTHNRPVEVIVALLVAAFIAWSSARATSRTDVRRLGIADAARPRGTRMSLLFSVLLGAQAITAFRGPDPSEVLAALQLVLAITYPLATLATLAVAKRAPRLR